MEPSRKGRLHFDRVEADGGSWIFPKSLMSAGYWAIQPLGAGLVRLRIRPDHLTWASMAAGAGAGLAFAGGRPGWALAAAGTAALLDALDGLVARLTGAASRAGEVLDSGVDRYVEFFWFAGLALHYRANAAWLALALAALHGSYMVSYLTALSKASRVRLGRGIMKRPDRLIVVLAGTALAAAGYEWGLRAAIVAIAALANLSALARFAELRRALRRTEHAPGGG